ncbi:RagB/SusD family nutrient uptake outer membrane protein [Mucilaginibacter sp. Bleaf8]|uniref:RagB/SusD family nutrient uptake outer membrane protein n=1 Tax=Mucilaginibacter sp. Bleaf8 TaxID=2834430 RepID=UPI001BCD53A7|nr:RagB/SusD family nutrient uptake outer membrane protein [Mucilaginibacter sp. Bleaf8]MBS7563725.1 RagB/SusD family nutrient uptake outer membrane protein [Mucilaginibacter sp. Bleaf8]
MKIRILECTAALMIIIGVISATSCKKILDLNPHNSTFTNAYFTNGTDANTAIAGAYALLRSVLLNNSSFHVYGDATAKEFNILSGKDNQNYNISNGEFTGLNVGSGNWNWQNYYQLLQQINLVINKVPDIPINTFTNQDDKKRIIGEAYFLRAYTYFYMSRVWGDVPLKLAPDLDISQAKNIPRSPAADVMKQCLADLKIAEDNLTFGYTDQNQRAVRANKGSAFALEAHIQAWTHNYSACEQAAAQVIDNGGYSLVTDTSQFGKVFVGKSVEGIFEININYGQSEGIAVNNGGYTPTLKFPFIYSKTDLQWPTNKEYVNKLYTDTLDIRYAKYFFQAQSESNGQTIKFSNITYADGSAKNDPRVSNNLIIFRLADIMLLRAEALNHLGRDGEALLLLNKVRQRAHIANYSGTGDELNRTILEERLRELFYEGHAFYDLVRIKKIGNPTSSFIADYNSRFDDTRINAGGNYWPIDPTMFKDDFVLKQTPYWQGKL